MNSSQQTGHALSITMIIMILFSILSLTTLQNGLIDQKIARAFAEQQKNEERQLSVLRYFEIVTLRQLFDPETELFRHFQLVEDGNSLQLSIPYRSLLGSAGSDETNGLTDPLVDISRAGRLNSGSLLSPDHVFLRAEIQNPNTNQLLNATFEIPVDPDSGVADLSAVKQLSLQKLR